MLALEDAARMIIDNGSYDPNKARLVEACDCDEAFAFVHVSESGWGTATVIKKDTREVLYEDPFWVITCEGYGKCRPIAEEELTRLGFQVTKLD